MNSSRLEWFIPTLSLLNGLLLLPGTQPLRFGIRAAPYAISLGFLALFRKKNRAALPPGGFVLQLVLLLLVLNLFHPETQLKPGLAQILLQLAIVSPMFWAAGLIDSDRRLFRLLWILFACNAIGMAVGLLQIYFPDQFLPAEFSAGATANWVHSLTFTGPTGRLLVRPPGLSDLPGGAAVAGSFTAMLGFAFSSLRATPVWLRFVTFAAALGGIAVLYLTQVRSLTVMTLVAVLLLTLFGITRGRLWNRTWMGLAAIVLIVGSFGWAATVGGDKVRDRFLNLGEAGMVSSFDASRGYFWRYTFGEALEKYPLGAGPGRWGMMDVYFADHASPSLWAEIQPTGWLYDGGVPMWILYGASLLASMLFLLRVSNSPRYGEYVPFAAALAFCINCNIIGASFSGPTFNTTMGLQYWLLIAVVYGAARHSWRGPAPLLAPA